LHSSRAPRPHAIDGPDGSSTALSLLDHAAEPGPHPGVRAILGLAVGIAAGVLAGLLIPRERRLQLPPLHAVPDPPLR
jgi:hypothetical protein